MASEKTREGAAPRDAERRALLKAATVAGGAVAASALLPGSWRKPVATIGGLPAHAQASAQIILTNPSASITDAGDRAANGYYGIRVECGYTDTQDDFGGNHYIEYKITPKDSTDAARGLSECLVPIQKQLGDLAFFDMDGTSYQGNVEFGVITTCGWPSKINFRIFLGGHTSAWTGDIEIVDL